MNLLSNYKKPCHDLQDIIKICLTLSHGNACVESGFSINKEILDVNMKEISLVVQRSVYEKVVKQDDIFKVDINKKLMEHVKRSHRYSPIVTDERKKAQTE